MIGETETGGERIKEDKESAESKPQIGDGDSAITD